MKLENLSAGYGKNIIVSDISIEVKKGEIISLIGPNGGGKSTVLKTISGALWAVQGSVFMGKDEIKNISLKELATRLSIVTTDRIKPELMTCKEVVLSGRLPFTDGFGRLEDKDREAAGRAISLMKIDKIKDKYFDSLSDGQKQRTIIARAICQKPQYLIMDEPTSYLDIRYRMELMEVIRNLSKEGITVIMSLHELELALGISDRVIMIGNDGRADIAYPKDILKNKVLKVLYGMDEDMYEKVSSVLYKALELTEEPDERRHSSYFVNKKCEYFPCHDLPENQFSCMFCYCPLYDMEDCGGTYTFTDKGAKNCKNCTFPHDRDNYGKVIKKLKEKMYGNS